jgi:hypothetical protein
MYAVLVNSFLTPSALKFCDVSQGPTLLMSNLGRCFVSLPSHPPDLMVLTLKRMRRQANACSARRRSSTVSKVLSHNTCSLRVRMKRSAQPLPSGSRTKASGLRSRRRPLVAPRMILESSNTSVLWCVIFVPRSEASIVNIILICNDILY